MVLDSYSTLRLTRHGRVLHAYFNNPATLNAIGQVAHNEIARFFTEVSTDVDTDVIVLSGMGRAFSAGGDLEFIQRQIDEPSLLLDDMPIIMRIIFA